MSSFQLLDPAYRVDYLDSSTLDVFPAIAVKEVVAYPNENGTMQTLRIGSASNVDIAGSSNVNMFFNNELSLYTRPSSNTYARGGQSLSNLLMKFTLDTSSAFARIDAGIGAPLLVSGADSLSKTQVSKVVFTDNGVSAIVDTTRADIKFLPNTLFDQNISVGGNVIASGNVFGNTLTAYSDTGSATANSITRVAYSFVISSNQQLQLVKSAYFNDAGNTTVSRVVSTFGAGTIPMNSSTNASNVPTIIGGSSGGSGAIGFTGGSGGGSSSGGSSPWVVVGSNLQFTTGDVTVRGLSATTIILNSMNASNVSAPLLTMPGSTSNITFVNPTSTNVTRIDASGNFVTTGNVTSFGSVSDQRFKHDVEDLEEAEVFDKLTQLRPVHFTWNDSIAYQEKAGTRDWGMIAQEVQQVLPGMVDSVPAASGDSDMLIVRYEKLIPYLLKAVQVLAARCPGSI